MLPSTESIFTENENLKIEIQGLRSQVEREREPRKTYEEEISRLHEMLNDLKRLKFGKKSERWESVEQLVFNEAEVESRKPDPLDEEAEVEIKVSDYTKKRGHRRSLPENLEREEVIVELPESERYCPVPRSLTGFEGVNPT